jgi:hypothetical protein
MGQIDEIEAKLDWCVSALKFLLSHPSVGYELPPVADYDEPDAEIVQMPPPRPPVAKPCPHNQQVLVNGAVKCARCGFLLVQGGIVKDPNRNGRLAAQTEWGANSLRESDPLPT